MQPAIQAGSLRAPYVSFEFAIYYLPIPSEDPMQSMDEILASDFSGLHRVEELEKQPARPSVSARLLTDVAKSYAPPPADMLVRFGRGLSKEQAEAMQGSQHALLLDFAHPSEKTDDSLRAACQLASKLARRTGGLLWDEETREVFTPDAWDERRLKDWQSGVPDVARHTLIHTYKTGEYVRAITLGMVKFGLPDVMINESSWSENKQVGHIINLFGQAMAEGATVVRAGEFDLDLKSIANASVREPQMKSLLDHATARALLTLREGVHEEGDPHNALIEIAFDRNAGHDAHARRETAIGTLFGWKDSIKNVQHDGELVAASNRARAQLPALRADFAKGLAPGELILLKAPFDTPGGGHEYMWIEVTAWSDETIKGLLKNEPFNIPTLHSGEIVEIKQANAFDYIRRLPDGTQTGNETGVILERMPGSERSR